MAAGETDNPYKIADNGKVAAKAILITLVVLGHNTLFRSNFYNSLYLTIYGFHVGSFFLLSTLNSPRGFSFPTVKGAIIKLYYPFFIFTVIYGFAYLPFSIYADGGSLLSWISNLSLALVVGTSPFLDAATGLKLLWFLPSFTTFCIILGLYNDSSGRWRHAFWVVSALMQPIIGLSDKNILSLLPFGSALALYLIFPALVFKNLATRSYGIIYTSSCISTFLISSFLVIRFGVRVELSDFIVPGVSDPLSLILSDIHLISGAMTCLLIARRIGGYKLPRIIGENSFQIYLLHSPINYLITYILSKWLIWEVTMILSVALAIIGSILIASCLRALGISEFLFFGRLPSGGSRPFRQLFTRHEDANSRAKS